MARILVIDDEPSIRSIVRTALEGEGHDIDEAPEGASGLSSYRRAQHDLVITNLYMPGKEGIETIEELRALNAELPIIAMSGGDSRRYQRILDLALELGASRTLAKPFRIEALQTVVAELLQETAA